MDFTDFLHTIKTPTNSSILESLTLAFNTLFESSKKEYVFTSLKGTKVKTTVPPSERSFKNIPKYSDGKKKVDFKEWLEIKPISIGVGKGCDGKWYGWSHRAVYGFTIGDSVKEGDSGYKGKEYTIKTEEEAKQAAIDFADSVS